MIAQTSGHTAQVHKFHTKQAMFARLTQDHKIDLANLATTTQFDRTAFITLMAKNAILMQQLIDVDLKLIKVVAEVAQLKIESPAQASTKVPTVFSPND